MTWDCCLEISQKSYIVKIVGYTVLVTAALPRCFLEQDDFHLFALSSKIQRDALFSALETRDREQILLIHKCLFQLFFTEHYFIIASVGANQKMSLFLYPIILPSMEQVQDLFYIKRWYSSAPVQLYDHLRVHFTLMMFLPMTSAIISSRLISFNNEWNFLLNKFWSCSFFFYLCKHRETTVNRMQPL